ncbi:MAG TPA: cell division protein FtsQ/DivIB [Candidatus Woesebacteria bacterium]|nr:cell division protein FtsQ/DivIB [Candidatus Woesebacteria bacterium]
MLPILKLQLKLLLTFACWMASILLMKNSQWMQVTAIECQLSSSQNCNEELSQELNQLVGNSLVDMKLDEVLPNNTKLQARYQLVGVNKKFPNSLNVTFSTVESVYFLEKNGSRYVVTDEGKIIPNGDEGIKLPQLIGAAEQLLINPGEPHPTQVNPELHQHIHAIVKQAEKYHVMIDLVEYFSPNRIELTLENQLQLVVNSDTLNQDFQRLELILKSKELQEQLNSNSTIDLRFAMPIVNDRSTQGL